MLGENAPMRSFLKKLVRAVRRKTKAPHRQPLIMGALQGVVEASPVGIAQWTGGPEGERLRAIDNWFHSHYVFAPYAIRAALEPRLDLSLSTVLDLGCGDGIMALGVKQLGAKRVVGTDLTRAFDGLPARARQVLGLQDLPEGLVFDQGQLGQPLAFSDGEFDAVYSWSVFEHVDGVPWLLGEVKRVMRPGGLFFLQIEPLYYSPYGSHLRRLLQQPWAHLLHSPDAYLALATSAQDHTRKEEMDDLYRSNEFDDTKRYLIGEYHSLNRIRSIELVNAVRTAGFEILSCEIGQVRGLPIPPALKDHHDEHDLRTNEIRLVMTRT